MRHTRWMRALLLAAVLGGCGSTPATSASSTPSPTPTATATPVVTPTPVVTTSLPAIGHPMPTPATSTAQLRAVAAAVYPACTPSTCPGGGGSYTTCDAGHSGSNVYSACPLTGRLAAQLKADTSGGAGGDPLGGGQDPVWQTESITEAPSSTGGVAHVVLGFTGSSTREAIDLLIVAGAGGLAVDDLYCTGSDPSTSDAYAPGWDGRATCSG